jgi:hypothetical protein
MSQAYSLLSPSFVQPKPIRRSRLSSQEEPETVAARVSPKASSSSARPQAASQPPLDPMLACLQKYFDEEVFRRLQSGEPSSPVSDSLLQRANRRLSEASPRLQTRVDEIEVKESNTPSSPEYVERRSPRLSRRTRRGVPSPVKSVRKQPISKPLPKSAPPSKRAAPKRSMN